MSNSKPNKTTTSRWRGVALSFGFWTLFGLLGLSQLQGFYFYTNQQVPLWRTILTRFPVWYLWAIVTPLIFYLGRRFHYEHLSRLAWGGTHFLTALASALLHVTVTAYFFYLFPANPARPTAFKLMWWGTFSGAFHYGFLFYGAVLAVGHAVEYYRRYRERELTAERLSRQLAQAELNALKMQLHPHFLFNTLHSIAVLVRKEENKAAVKMLSGLSDLLRLTLTQAAVQLVPLKQEMEFAEQYLELEQVRFQDRLQIKFGLAPETLAAQIPYLILQPLVENAVRHGIAQRSAAGLIEISAWREAGKLWLQVRDDGPGLTAPHATAEHTGVGLANARARLQQLYGGDYSFEVRNEAAGGVSARLGIPYNPAHPEQTTEA